MKDRKKAFISLFFAWTFAFTSCISTSEQQLNESICIEANEECSRIFDRGTKLPTSFSEEFSNHEVNQEEIGILLYGGEGLKVEGNRLIGEFHLPIKPAANAGDARVQITIIIDASKRISIIAKDLETGHQEDFLAGLAK